MVNFHLIFRYADVLGVFLYKLDDRWRVSPDYESKKSWFFSKKGAILSSRTQFYVGDEANNKTHKSKFRIGELESIPDTCEYIMKK